jgi:hypothetical protein
MRVSCGRESFGRIRGQREFDCKALVVCCVEADCGVALCSQFCGFHTRQTLSAADIKWAFVGNTDRCPSSCEIQSTGPNSPASGVGGADGLINVLTHETEEAITDPDLNAWFDSSGAEDADKCNFRFGPTTTCTVANGCTSAAATAAAKFNQTFGGHNWMMQMEWENSRGGGCAQTLGGPFF